MWIGDVDVPQAVLDAAEASNLVFFVGAGASCAPPSSLPDFPQLVRKIGARAERNPSDAEVNQPDVFLGRLNDTGVDVHGLVAAEINRVGARPNELHTAIVGLAAACGKPRIVTTNYDRHLTRAAGDLALDFEIYEAPALPLGNDFEGVVHLHGSLSQPSRRLVVTDTDFGHAYLREAWAARFLERMFSTFTVVFIGYSHGDVVMQYLARSLGPDHNRYVFTDKEQNKEWRSLGLIPISYPNATGSNHSALPLALTRWRELATMGHVEHRARIADLVSREPPTIPEEGSYVEAALAHPERIRYFTEKARFDDTGRSHRWFSWIESRPAFLALFAPSSAGEPATRNLASWITDQYILSEECSKIALRSFREKPWPPDTWHEIARALAAYKGAFPRWLNPWLELVLQNAPTRQHHILDLMLAGKDWSGNLDLALMVLEDRTRPQLKRSFDFGATDQPRFEVDLRGNGHQLRDNWIKIFLPALDRCLAQVLSLATEQISRVYRNLRGLDPDGSFDPVSFSRSAIEPHAQDSHRDSIDVLIDVARDSIEVALTQDRAIGEGYLAIWSSSPNAILRRLAVHGWRVRTDIGSDEKLNWLFSQNMLWEKSLQHEVFYLVRDALPTASADLARKLVDAAAAGPPGDDYDHSNYRSYNLLGWLADSAPELRIATAAFGAAQKAHPEFDRREFPDLNHYTIVGSVEDALPFPVLELHELIGHDPGEALDRLRVFKGETFALEGPTWTGALYLLRACVTTYAEDGLKLAAVLLRDDNDIRESLIYGWDSATLNETQVAKVLTIISGWPLDEIRGPVSSLLSNGGNSEHPTGWHQFDSARTLAASLWPPGPMDSAVDGGKDILLEAINHPAGKLAEFWTKVVQWEWTKSESTWDGLPESAAVELDRLISASDRNGLLAKSVLASRLRFFFGADQKWCEDRLLPLFDWTNEDEATAAWQGFLTWGRWDDGLLKSGLLDSYLATAAHAGQLSNELVRQLASHLASITMFASIDPARWLTRFIPDATEELQVLWTQQVERTLIELGPDKALGQWDRWIQAYWSDRNQSLPRPFTHAEASATARWVIGLPGVRSQAVDLAVASPAGLDLQDGFLYRIKDLDIAAEASDWARLLTHLLMNTSGHQGGIYDRLQEIVPQLREGDPPPDLTELIDQATRLGATKAGDW